MIKGQCNCGAVAFEILTGVSDIYMCHCSVCRQSTGCQGVAVVVVENSVFRWLHGEEHICTWEKPDQDWQTSFCRTCGSSLPGVNDESHMYVPAGLITNGSTPLKVAHHIWVTSKADCFQIGDDGKQHNKSFES